MGAEAVQKSIKELDIDDEIRIIREEIPLKLNLKQN